MKRSKISDYISGLAVKSLSSVEVDSVISHQHELNGISKMKEIFGLDRRTFRTDYIFLPDDVDKVIHDHGSSTWYDARENHATRTEFRLYYPGSDAIKNAKPGDLMFLCLKKDGDLLMIVTPQGSSSESQLLWLFNLSGTGSQLIIKEFSSDDMELNFSSRYIFEQIGIDAYEDDTFYFEQLVDKFGYSFPPTKEFSEFARSTCSDVSDIDDPDHAIMQYLDREEALFRLLERHILKDTIGEYFVKSDEKVMVDQFVSLSLSVINRRKSRAGHAFEHHLAHIFNKNRIRFSKGASTERNNRPDFIFPSVTQYHDASFPASLLTMLGVKTSAKDRWRQVLTEAAKISEKHLITIQPAITQNQTEEIRSNNLQLVIPEQIRSTYSSEQNSHIINLGDFVKHVAENQSRIKELGVII